MEKKEIKQFIKQTLCRSPALTYYLESNRIYGRYVSKATDFFYREHKTVSYYETDERIKDNIRYLIIIADYPLYFAPELSRYDTSRQNMEDIYNL